MGKYFLLPAIAVCYSELQSVPLKKQGAAMEKALSDWMGHLGQIDDILVMGLRINEN